MCDRCIVQTVRFLSARHLDTFFIYWWLFKHTILDLSPSHIYTIIAESLHVIISNPYVINFRQF